MRYRPFTRSGLSASAITLVLDDPLGREAERVALLRAALECGVNSFELATAAPEVAHTLADAIEAVGRRSVVVSLRVGRSSSDPGEAADFSPAALTTAVETALDHTSAERFDAVTLDAPGAGELSSAALDALEGLRRRGDLRMIGLSGDGAAVDGYLAARGFDLLATPFNMSSGWTERNRIKSAVARGMTIMGEAFELERVVKPVEAARKGLARLFHRPSATRDHAYEFTHRTPGWTAAQIGLAFALTEPALATVRVHARTAAALESLAEAVERELPAGLAAQIEMARFAEVA